jgi:SM-20-related protein
MIQADFISDLSLKSFSVKDQVFSYQEIELLKQYGESLFGSFKPAHVGEKNNRLIESEIRRDKTLWVTDREKDNQLQKINKVLSFIQSQVNEKLFLGLFEVEVHWAFYEKGDFYKPHKDVHQKGSSRVLTWILYLNNDWKKEHGGELKIYHGNTSTVIEPLGGRMVVFLSSEILHEVCICKKNRWSLTGWFHHRSENELFSL